MHRVVGLWDAHSIRSVVPRFFDGRLPDLNLGTGGGASCDARIAARVFDTARAATGYSAVLNGRFTGGYITRHYGRPDDGVHAIQLEMTQCSYMDETPPFAYAPALAARVQPHVRRLVETFVDAIEAAGRA